MKLKNKKTGETMIFDAILPVKDITDDSVTHLEYSSLAELNAEWEDVPEEPKSFWTINTTFDCAEPIVSVTEISERYYNDEDAKSIGNYFETKEEAELAVRKLKAWKRLKDKGFKIKGWKFTPDTKHIEGNYVRIEAEIPQILINEKDLDLLFPEEDN